ncbi:MAG: TetR/AcrR family transcriptional regulator [Marmoricola sp.]
MSVAILDAAQRIFEQFGARRANVEDVARAAGVSRSTLYRAYATKDDLLAAVLARQATEFLDELDRATVGLPPRDAVVEAFSRGIALTREIPLLARLVETEPEIITGVGGLSNTSLIIDLAGQVAATLRRSGATMPESELNVVAELMMRVAYTYILNPGGNVDMKDDAVVHAYAKQYLAPLVY